MKILLDHCIDRRFAHALLAHDVHTAQQMGWDTLKNGMLLAQAGRQFDVMVTVDQHLKDQQNLAHLPLAVVVMLTKSNRLADLLPLAPRLLAMLPTLEPCKLVEIAYPSLDLSS